MKNHNMFISVGQATEALKWDMFGVKMRRYTQRNRAQMNEQQTGGRKNIQRSISGEGKIKKKDQINGSSGKWSWRTTTGS